MSARLANADSSTYKHATDDLEMAFLRSRVRIFMRSSIGFVVAFAIALQSHGAETTQSPESSASVRITLAQIRVSSDIKDNLNRIENAISIAEHDSADWVLFPEGALSFSADGDQTVVAAAFDEVRELCKTSGVIGLIGTYWKENANTFNQVRVVNRDGQVIAVCSKKCLTYDDAKVFKSGESVRPHVIDGISAGVLICNDMWVTPGFTDGPDPHLSRQLAKAGARAILHSVNSGSNQNFREYHEANLKVRSAEAGCPFVVVNAAQPDEINCTSGVVDGFHYIVELPRVGEHIKTVEVQLPPKGN
jgi:predicted amidohydrolase